MQPEEPPPPTESPVLNFILDHPLLCSYLSTIAGTLTALALWDCF
jgi:hypothetical protein